MKEDTIKRHDKKDLEPSPIKLILTLGIAGLLSGIAIVGIYEVTKPTITAYQAKMLREAVFKVLPGVTQIQKMRYTGEQLQADNSEQDDEDILYAGYNVEGNLVGYAIPGAGPGFQDTISLLYGYRPDEKTIVGMEILESRETPGLGDKIYKDANFVANFKALTVEPSIVLVKKGTKSAKNEVDAISGATISCKAVVRIINQTNEKWLERLSKK